MANKNLRFLFFCIICIILYTQNAHAQLSIDAKDVSYSEELVFPKTLSVGYTDYNSEFDIDLWHRVSKTANFKYKLIKYDDLGSLFKDIQNSKVHVGMGGISITPEREIKVDFSKPYLNTGLKIAILENEQDPTFIESITDTTFIIDFLSSMASPEVKVIFFWFVVFIIVMAHIIWFAERDSFKTQKNTVESGELSESYWKGIWEAIYFCLVTSSTVGYGDFTCRRFIGRLSSAVVIIAGVSFFANLTACIAAERAVDIVSKVDIKNFHDLENKKVATKTGVSTSIDKLMDVGATIVQVPGDKWIESAKKMLKNGQVDAIVWDSPLIDKIQDPEIRKIDKMFYPQYYGFCLQEDSPIEERLNVSLLSILGTNDYPDLIKKHYNR